MYNYKIKNMPPKKKKKGKEYIALKEKMKLTRYTIANEVFEDIGASGSGNRKKSGSGNQEQQVKYLKFLEQEVRDIDADKISFSPIAYSPEKVK